MARASPLRPLALPGATLFFLSLLLVLDLSAISEAAAEEGDTGKYSAVPVGKASLPTHPTGEGTAPEIPCLCFINL